MKTFKKKLYNKYLKMIINETNLSSRLNFSLKKKL